jgi:hypothetical protein
VGIRQIHPAGFECGDDPESVGDHERQVGGNSAQDWYSQKGALYIYTYIVTHVYVNIHIYI